MTALICGSLAFDTIMVFKDRFKNHILPDKVHMLNVSFLVPDLRREYGGCAGNVAYNLSLLGGDCHPLGTVGDDFGPYADWMDAKGVSRRYLKTIEGSYTAQAYITSDLDDNQITAFHPGAMGFSEQIPVPRDAGIRIGIVSPDSLSGMQVHARQFAEADIPFIFDPGQAMPLMDGKLLMEFIEQATWLAANDYEYQLIQERTGLSAAQLAERVEALIVTRGGEGSTILAKSKQYDIPTARPERVVDPTGCGDAYRAGLLYGLMGGLDWDTTGRIAALLGALKIECHGTQNHAVTLDGLRARFRENFSYAW